MTQVEIIGRDEKELRIALKGEIDAGNAEEFYQSVIAAYEQAPAPLVFSCEDLEFIDSTTLGTFVKLLKKVKTDGFGMKLVGLQAKIKKLFLICSLDTIMEIA
ncbi:MAG: STAS domain-containing protein [Clostridia bacterium]|nr:STAS domain-containing protein [Clostridia bacterium]